ncbi:MAG: cytochrome P450 [Saprospiraceae bacterium]|nr:cytochrome P450 [Saprospiraceae bacterium]MCF8249390.1 cytochrome P450 [Saprospiraceae bacterium]MCF8279044.1 cytochrome P450 [Bacteroidales bacterium]MCF8311519.1 cytochrome P450 [Saprospiraceae bacterium]MCF8440009.1 cytochrome P450 [Saprospiraceae bacterium]
MPTNIPVLKGKNPLLPGVGFLRNPFEFTIKQAQEMGDFFMMPFLTRKIFIITNHEVVAHVLQKNQKNYIKSPAYRQLRLALGTGLVTSEGEYWRRQRRLVQPAFYKTQLEDLFRGMVVVAEKYMAELEGKCVSGVPLDMAKEMMAATARIVLKTLFSTENTADINEMYLVMMDAQDYLTYRTVKPYFIPLTYLNGKHRKFKKDIAWFDGYIYKLIAERRNDPNPPNDLLTMLLASKDEETGEAMSDRALRDEAVTLFAAGHETSATMLSWALWLLSQHSEVVQEMRDEIAEVLEDRMPGFEDLRKLTYTMQVIQEVMRLFPPGFAIGRQPIAEDEILGVKIPKSAIMFISIAAMHRDPRYWERPTDFYPEHFTPEREKTRQKVAYMPFGAGPRMCIGNHFALMEMQLLLTLLVRQFDFESVEGHPVEAEPLITLKPKYGILMHVSKRRMMAEKV